MSDFLNAPESVASPRPQIVYDELHAAMGSDKERRIITHCIVYETGTKRFNARNTPVGCLLDSTLARCRQFDGRNFFDSAGITALVNNKCAEVIFTINEHESFGSFDEEKSLWWGRSAYTLESKDGHSPVRYSWRKEQHNRSIRPYTQRSLRRYKANPNNSTSMNPDVMVELPQSEGVVAVHRTSGGSDQEVRVAHRHACCIVR